MSLHYLDYLFQAQNKWSPKRLIFQNHLDL